MRYRLDARQPVLIDVLTLGILAIGLWGLAAFGTSYVQGSLVLFAINAILVLSYRTITTMGGWSFAHIAVMGVGGYAVGILSKPPFDFPVLATIGIGGLLAASVAGLLAFPVLRTRQYYFFLATFAAGEALRQCFIQFRQITGGTSGIAFIEYPAFLTPQAVPEFLGLVVVTLLILGLGYLSFDASETGLKIRAVGQDETLARSLGMNAWTLRASAFVLGSFGAGIAGGLLVSYNGIVSPSDFGPALMFKVVAACIVGGTRRLYGPLLGLVFLTLVEEIFRGVPEFVPFIWGALVLASTLYLPGGLEGVLETRFSRNKGGARHA